MPQARLFEEILKLLLSGNAVECVRLLRELELHHGLLPLLDMALDDPEAGPFAMAALRATDERIAADKPVSPAFLLAALLWGQVERNFAKFEAKGQPSVPALHSAMHEALDVQRDSLAIPRRFDATMKELWLMQPRFLQRGGNRPYRLLEHPRFRAAYDFFALRAASGNAPQEAARLVGALPGCGCRRARRACWSTTRRARRRSAAAAGARAVAGAARVRLHRRTIRGRPYDARGRGPGLEPRGPRSAGEARVRRDRRVAPDPSCWRARASIAPPPWATWTSRIS